MIKKLQYILLVIIAFSSCKKVDIEVPVDTPVFSINAEVDGATLNWEAGNDNFFMFTEFEKDDSLNLYTLIGRLAKDNDCTNDCEESLTFKIRGNEATPSVNDFDINQALLITDYNFKKISNPSIAIMDVFTFEGEFFNTDSIVNPQVSYFWTINGDTMMGQTVTYVTPVGENINLNVVMMDNSACTTSFTQNNLNSMSDCQMNIQVDNGVNGEFSIIPVFSNGIFPNNIWNNNSNNSDSIFLISPNNPVIGNELNLVASDPQGLCTLEYKMCLIDTIGGVISAINIPQVTYNVQQDSVIDPIDEQFSHVEIEYQDSTGVYSTFNGDNNNSTFTITKVEAFEDNAEGEKTKKLTIDYEAVVYDTQGSGNSKTINGSGVIGVAYPD